MSLTRPEVVDVEQYRRQVPPAVALPPAVGEAAVEVAAVAQAREVIDLRHGGQVALAALHTPPLQDAPAALDQGNLHPPPKLVAREGHFLAEEIEPSLAQHFHGDFLLPIAGNDDDRAALEIIARRGQQAVGASTGQFVVHDDAIKGAFPDHSQKFGGRVEHQQGDTRTFQVEP